MANQFRRLAAWLILAASLVCYFTALVLLVRGRITSLRGPIDPTDISLLVYVVVGLLIVTHYPHHLVGWLFLFIGFSHFIFAVTNAYILYALLVDPRLPVNQWALALPSRMWVVTFFISPLLLMIFPNGRLLSPRWRWVVWLVILCNVLQLIANGSLIETGSFSYEMTPVLTLLGRADLTERIQDLGGITLLISLIAVLVSIVIRFRRSKGKERLQIKWFSFAALAFVILQLILDFGFFNGLTALDPTARIPADLFLGIPTAASFTFIPLAAAFAILHHHLYDIDIIIRKTLIYGALSVTLGLIFFGSVILTQTIVHALTGEGDSPAVIVISTLTIVGLFTPLRRRLQNWIDKRFYRRRYDAEKILALFTATVRDEVDLTHLTGHLLSMVDQALQPDRLSLWIVEKNHTVLPR